MKDFPMFTTEWGVASLILREVPYRQEAYIHVQDVQPDGFEAHMKECVAFCRMVGAERIYASGHPLLEAFELYTSVYEMKGTAWVDPSKVEHLFPVTEIAFLWNRLFREKFSDTIPPGRLWKFCRIRFRCSLTREHGRKSITFLNFPRSLLKSGMTAGRSSQGLPVPYAAI